MQQLLLTSVCRRYRIFWLLFATTLAPALVGCAETAVRLRANEAQRAGHYDEAVQELRKGLGRYPDSIMLRSSLLQVNAEAQAKLISLALSQRADGQLDEGQETLQKALTLDPLSERIKSLLKDFEQERRSLAELILARQLADSKQSDRALRQLEQSLKDSPRHGGLLDLQRRLLVEQRSRQVQALSGVLSETRPISLDFRDASLRTVLDVVTRHSGVNFVLDRDVRAESRVTVLVRQAKVEDALDLITSSNQLAKKIIDPRTIIIYPNTSEKHREYQEQLVRVFNLANSDAKGAAAFLKAMLKIREPFVDERSNMVALRDSPENIQLAERLIAVYDSVEPEVLLEVEVLEVSTTRLTELGVKFPASFTLTPLAPSNGGFTLGNVGDITRNQIGIGLGNMLVNLRREVGDVATLANPKLRVRNKEKAKILIGDKIPVIAATTGTGGFVAETVSYLDVGLKLDVEPAIYVDDEVAIKVSLEVSSLGTAIKTNSGSVAYQIGTRNATTLLRLRDGETQLLAGLISKDERSTASRVPGLGDMPVLGRLFSSQTDDGKRTELLLAVTPRILRNVKRLNSSESELWVGTDANPRLRQVGGLQIAPPLSEPSPAGSNAPSAQQNMPAAVVGAPGLPMNDAPPQKPLNVSVVGPRQVKVGESFDAKVELRDAALRGLTTEVEFDPVKLELISVEEDEFFRKGDSTTSFTRRVEGGRINLGVLRSLATQAEGLGAAFKMRFKARLASTGTLISVKSVQPIAIGQAAGKPVTTDPLTVEVQ